MSKLKRMLYEKASSTKEDLLTAIRESWNHSAKECCFKFVKSMKELKLL